MEALIVSWIGVFYMSFYPQRFSFSSLDKLMTFLGQFLRVHHSHVLFIDIYYEFYPQRLSFSSLDKLMTFLGQFSRVHHSHVMYNDIYYGLLSSEIICLII